jgi:transcriptional regulator with XRE-family HTH domain
MTMEQLKRLRRERGLSQAKLAARADIDPSTMNQIERGARDPSASTLKKLAAALDVSIAELFEEVDPKARGRALYEPSFDNALTEERQAGELLDVVETIDELPIGMMEDALGGGAFSRLCLELQDDRRIAVRGYRS